METKPFSGECSSLATRTTTSCCGAVGKGSSSRINHLVRSFLCSSSQHLNVGDVGLAEHWSEPHHEGPISNPVMRRARQTLKITIGTDAYRLWHKRGSLKPTILAPLRLRIYSTLLSGWP